MRADRWVRRNDLLSAVWPRSEVTDGVLSQAMLELRTAFDDDPKHPRFIETIRGVGFRLIPPVRWQGLEAVVVTHPAAVPDASEANREVRRGRRALGAGIALAVVIVALVAATVTYYSGGRELAVTQSDMPYIMVAPFEGASADGGDGYFAHGIAEQIALQLGASDQLRLFSGQALRLLLAGGEQPLSVAERFGVDLILTGSASRHDSYVRLVVELADAKSGEQRWIATYERPLDDLLSVQSEVARAVVGVLTGRNVLPARTARTARTTSLTAYDYYLRGREFLGLHRFDTNEQSISLFREALALDPEFHAARASLAEALANRGYVYQRGENALIEALAEADRALAHDATLAQAHYVRLTALTGLGRLHEADEAAMRAIAASPNYSDAEFAWGVSRRGTRRPEGRSWALPTGTRARSGPAAYGWVRAAVDVGWAHRRSARARPAWRSARSRYSNALPCALVYADGTSR